MFLSSLRSIATTLQRHAEKLARSPLMWLATKLAKHFVLAVLKTGPMPRHVGLIMDGNRRYSKDHNIPVKDGHAAGSDALVSVLHACHGAGVREISVYAFSIDNFRRADDEVNALFALMRDKLRLLCNPGGFVDTEDARLRIIGNKLMIPPDLLADFEAIENATASHTTHCLNVCIPYTARDDMAHAIRAVATQRAANAVAKGHISEQLLADNMYAGRATAPLDLLIRTSGHGRLSDFMLWQCAANCEIRFVATLWPDFRFLSTCRELLGWSFRRHGDAVRVAVGITPERRHTSLRSLPAAPPLASVH